MAKASLSALVWEAREDARSLERFTSDARRVVAANTSATDAEVGKVIFNLLIMYDSFDRRGEQSKAMVVDQWRKSLTGWPIDVLEQAAQEWINGEKAAFVPQPGNILEACERIGSFRRAMAKKAAELLEMIGGAA